MTYFDPDSNFMNSYLIDLRDFMDAHKCKNENRAIYLSAFLKRKSYMFILDYWQDKLRTMTP